MKQILCGQWTMRKQGDSEAIPAIVPGSVYSNLLAFEKMNDPYYGENEAEALQLSEAGYSFERIFSVSKELLSCEKVLLQFQGLDTIAAITLNETAIGKTSNMHRTYEFDVKNLLREGENTLLVSFSSPIEYITKQQAVRPLWGVETTIAGYPHIRKAHYMYGWDWGPQLPDMGIWREVSLLGFNHGRIDSVLFSQEHHEDFVLLQMDISAQTWTTDQLTANITITAPDHTEYTASQILSADGTGSCSVKITNPQLWWPHGYGDQPLYSVSVSLIDKDTILDEKPYTIGLRTITISRENDQWGQEFCFMVNSVKIFAMGANYIPEDQIIARCSRDITQHLLEQCIKANYNCIRVWGGGYYPEDYFYDICDQLGLIVWQDFMFACAVYELNADFRENITEELIDNIKRLRHHASLGLWCGNNEIETAWEGWGIPQEECLRKDYIEQFERLFPQLCEKYSPQVFYWPSSPSCGGNFDYPGDGNRGDIHNWDIWHGMKPLTEFRKHYFRFCSEYGFESLPSLKTIKTFAEEKDFNLCSSVMEAHQKCQDGNKKLLYYLSQVLRYPYSFEMLIYATQLLQADAIRYSVEHMRRNRGRCMGSTYWQVNDSNPVISWSSLDYYHRWKALHYYAKRFYSPVLLSANEEIPSAVLLNISNEQRVSVTGKIHWNLRNQYAEVIAHGEQTVVVSPLTAQDCITLDLSNYLDSTASLRSSYLEYSFADADIVWSRGSSLFVQPKHFSFVSPAISWDISDIGESYVITLTAKSFAKSVCLDLVETDCHFSDNWFDIHGKEPVVVTVAKETLSAPLSLEAFKQQLTVVSAFDLG